MSRFLTDNATADKRDFLNCGKKPVPRVYFCHSRDWARASNWPNVGGHTFKRRRMNEKLKRYAKRMGLAAFLFFFLKGLGWIAVFYFGWQMVG